MENYIKIGETILGLTPEQVEKLKAEIEAPGRRRNGEAYWYINTRGEAIQITECGSNPDRARYDAGNYFLDEESAKQQGLRETLDRLLWRYSEQHGGDPEWDGNNEHWYIFYGIKSDKWRADYDIEYKHDNPYFCSREVAEAAIKEVVEPFCKAHPGFVW